MKSESPSNELLGRMLAAVAAGAARQDVEGLVAAARAQAEAEVTELIKSAIKASLLREVVGHLEANLPGKLDAGERSGLAGVEGAQAGRADIDEAEGKTTVSGRDWNDRSQPTACYVYAITSGLADPWTAPVPAVDEAFPLEVVSRGEFQAVVSEVPLGSFGQDALDANGGDRAWVEEKVRAHDRVVKAVAAEGAAIPCRFCTVLRSRADVIALLLAHEGRIRESLDKLRGRREWGVRIHFDVGRVAEGAGAPEELSGAEYLRQRKERDGRQVALMRNAREVAQECHQMLAGLSEAAALLTCRTGKGPVVELLNVAYLVDDERAGRFCEAVEELGRRHESAGLELVLTGPWPAYNFVNLDLSLEVAA